MKKIEIYEAQPELGITNISLVKVEESMYGISGITMPSGDKPKYHNEIMDFIKELKKQKA